MPQNIQYDGWPTVAPDPGTPEFRVEVESLKARWAGGDPSNPLDPNHVLLGAEETAWAEWQDELNAQAQPSSTPAALASRRGRMRDSPPADLAYLESYGWETVATAARQVPRLGVRHT